eukprot:2044200-Alexandrium_andersonii.AAC.1
MGAPQLWFAAHQGVSGARACGQSSRRRRADWRLCQSCLGPPGNERVRGNCGSQPHHGAMDGGRRERSFRGRADYRQARC